MTRSAPCPQLPGTKPRGRTIQPLPPETEQAQLENVPARSLNRSSGCGARTLGVCAESGDTEAAGATEAAATKVNDEELPHNF